MSQNNNEYQLRITTIVSRLKKYDEQKNKKIHKLESEVLLLKDQLRESKRREHPSQISRKTQYRDQCAIKLYNRWKTIRAIINRRKSAFDINEYLELREFVNFD